MKLFPIVVVALGAVGMGALAGVVRAAPPEDLPRTYEFPDLGSVEPCLSGEECAEGEGSGRDEDSLFGATKTRAGEGEAAGRDEDSLFGADEGSEDNGVGESGFTDEPASFELPKDPLTIGGQLYLRLGTQFLDGTSVGQWPLSAPNLLDLYLDARPVERVRAFFSGRLSYDPTVAPDETTLLGQPVEAVSVLVNQLWIKTDIARSVFLTVGQQRIKWGAARLWNPTDFINSTRRDPLAIFDERVGVPLVKVHVPIESLGWNFYAIALLDSATELRDVGGAFRLEAVVGPAEVTASALLGRGRETSFGLDISTPLGPVDVYAELAVIDASARSVWAGDFDLEAGSLPTATPRDSWATQLSAGFQYEFKPNDDDLMVLGAEYFYNPLGYEDENLYGWLAVADGLQPFYFGRHYAALFWLVPAPGSWNNSTFSFSTIGNLSDQSFLSRVDFSQVLHTRLRLEAYAQVHYGKTGGEFRFRFDVPDIPATDVLGDPIEAFTILPPRLLIGVNLRVSL